MTTAVSTTPTTATTATGTAATNQANIQAGVGNLSSSYSTFLTLLTTQLQNQDPTSPMDTNAFTQQLVSMTGVQQQLLTNELLQQMVTNSTGSSVAGSTNLIGKTVTATSSNATLSGGQASWGYNLPTAAAQATATISDSNGVTVWSGALSGLAAGQNSFTWNGQTSNGAQLADGGTYTLSVAAADSTGAAITPTVSVSGTVNSLQQVNGVAEAAVGATLVPLTSITEVTKS